MSLAECERAIISLDDGTVVDAVVGYRAWNLDAKHGVVQLRSLHMPDVYWSDEPMQAVCRCRAKAGDSDGPCKGTCGIYAWRKPPKAMLAAASKIWGTVYMWGDTSVREKAIVAEWAKIGGVYPIGYTRQRRIVELAAHQLGVPLLAIPASTRAVYARMDDSHRTVARLRKLLA